MKRFWLPATIVLLVYAPFSWLLFIDYSHTSYWWHWVRAWPVLPGFLGMMLGRRIGIESTLGETVAMGVTTAIGLTVCILIARRGRWWAAAVVTALTIWGVWIGLASHAIFRA